MVLEHRVGGQIREHLARLGQLFEANLVLVQPRAVGLAAGGLGLQFLVGDDAAGHGVHQQHLAGLQAALLHHGGGVDVEHAGLGGHQHAAVGGFEVAQGAQAVAVEHGPNLLAIGEDEGGRAVPGLHKRGVELVEGLFERVHLGVAVPGFGHQHHHHVRQRAARVQQNFHHVIEAGRVRLPGIDHRQQHVHFLGREVGRHVVAQARVKPVQIAAQGVDFAIMRQKAERLGQLPARKGVGRKPRMHQPEGRHHPLVAEVGEVAAHLVGSQLALVHDGFAGERGEVEHVHRGRYRLAHRLENQPPQHVELALEVLGGDDAGRPAEKHLLHHRLGGQRRGADAGRVHRHRPVAQQRKAQPRRRAVYHVVAGRAQGFVLGQKGRAHAVAARLGQADAEGGALFEQKPVRNLNEQAGPVAGVGVAAAGPAVLHVFEHGQRVGHGLVGFAAVEVGDEAGPAGIVLKFGAVEALGGVGGLHRNTEL